MLFRSSTIGGSTASIGSALGVTQSVLEIVNSGRTTILGAFGAFGGFGALTLGGFDWGVAGVLGSVSFWRFAGGCAGRKPLQSGAYGGAEAIGARRGSGRSESGSYPNRLTAGSEPGSKKPVGSSEANCEKATGGWGAACDGGARATGGVGLGKMGVAMLRALVEAAGEVDVEPPTDL